MNTHIKQIMAISLVLVMCLSALPLIAPSAEAAGEGWLDGWEYRKSHAINPAAGAGTNYPVLIHAMSGTGTDTTETYQGIPAGKVYLNGRAQADFDDIRFTAADGVTLLDYCVESKTDGVDAYIWVEIAADISSVGTTIYVYYGNAAATSASNGNAVFTFYDDCNDASYTDKWTKTIGTLTAAGDGYHVFSHVPGDWGWAETTNKFTIGTNGYAARTMMQFPGVFPTPDGEKRGGSFRVGDGTLYYDMRRVSTAAVVSQYGGSYITGEPYDVTLGSNMGIKEVRLSSNTAEFWWDGTQLGGKQHALTSSISGKSMSLGFQFNGGSEFALKMDWAIVRKYVQVEPTQGTFGTEEALSPTSITWTSVPSKTVMPGMRYGYIPICSPEATITVESKPEWLTLSNGVLSGFAPSAGSYSVSLKAVSGELVGAQEWTITVGSYDAGKDWTRLGCLFQPGVNMDTQEPTVIYDTNPVILTQATNVFKMWYKYSWLPGYVHYAESLDGINFVKYSGNPVLVEGIQQPNVLKVGTTYYLYVTDETNSQISRYSSSNGISWTSEGVVLSKGASGWDSVAVGNNFVWIEGSTWYMIYDARADTPWHVGLATSSDGLTWTKHAGNPIMSSSAGAGTVTKHGDIYYLWCWGNNDGHLPTDGMLYSSSDLHTWTQLDDGDPWFKRETACEGVGTTTGQVADFCLIEVNGVTYNYYNGGIDGSKSGYNHLHLAVSSKTIPELMGAESPAPTPGEWAPSFTSTPKTTATINGTYQYTPTTNETATISLVSAPEWMTVVDGTLTGTPTEPGSYSVTLKATSVDGTLSAYQSWNITVVMADDNSTIGGIGDLAKQYAWLIVTAAGVVGLVVYAVAARHPGVLAISIILLAVAALLKYGVL